MSSPRVRPVFRQQLAIAPRDFFAALAAALDSSEAQCRGHFYEDGAVLRIRREERRLWSPALHLHVDTELGVLHGKFCPSSPIWTAFVAIYLALGCITMASACYGWSQANIGEAPWALLGVPICAALAGFTYGAAFIGQGLGAEDMYELRSFVDAVAGTAPATQQTG